MTEQEHAELVARIHAEQAAMPDTGDARIDAIRDRLLAILAPLL